MKVKPSCHLSDDNEPQSVVCCVGDALCQRPDKDEDNYVTFTECENCSKECHDCCGKHLDVPGKLLETTPGFYCNKCIARLPKYLYPKIQNDGIPRNIPDKPYYGLSFDIFIKQQKQLREDTKKRKKNNLRKGTKDTARASKITRANVTKRPNRRSKR
jgi:hypothetical protein